jgi:hypothetical protein
MRAFACAVLLLGDPEGDLNHFAPLVHRGVPAVARVLEALGL